MKKILLIAILIFQLFNCMAQGTRKYTIEGKIKGLETGTHVFLSHLINDRLDTIAFTTTHNGTFRFEGQLTAEPEIHFIQIDSNVSKVGKTFFLVNSKIEIMGDTSRWPNNLKIHGSKPNDEYYSMLSSLEPDQKVIDSLFKELYITQNMIEKKPPLYQSNIDSARLSIKAAALMSTIDSLGKIFNKKMVTYCIQNVKSMYTPNLILKLEGVVSFEDFKKMFDGLSDDSKASFYGKILRERISYKEMSSKVRVGNKAPEFISYSADGKMINIKQIVKTHKLTLIDFWASWCPPCREEFNNLKKTYNKYANKGFHVVSISNDDNLNSWKKAMEKDQLPWTNVSDLDGNNGKLATIFNIQKLPTNFLLNNHGQIIAIDLFGNDLDEALNNHLSSEQ